MIHNTKVNQILLLFAAIILATVFAMWFMAAEEPPIKIGFCSTLTGKPSTWGCEARNGAMLAIEQTNAAGGINGRRVELLFRDDRSSVAEALRRDGELIDAGAVAIIGHYQSAIASKVAPLFNDRKKVLLSTSAVTPALTGKDDQIFRMNVPGDKRAPMLASYARKNMRLKKIAIVYETDNFAYTHAMYSGFKKYFEKYGGTITKGYKLDSGKDYSADAIARELLADNPGGIYLITNSINAAILCQHIRKHSDKVRIIAGGWAFTDPAFIQNGGKAVEGVITISAFSGDYSKAGLRKFSEVYRERFGDEASEASCNGYDAAMILLEALRRQKPGQPLKQVLLEMKDFPGRDGEISFDRYGDPVRPVFVLTIYKGKITTLDMISPAQQPKVASG